MSLTWCEQGQAPRVSAPKKGRIRPSQGYKDIDLTLAVLAASPALRRAAAERGGLSVHELAELCGCSPATVKAALASAYAKLRTTLSADMAAGRLCRADFEDYGGAAL